MLYGNKETLSVKVANLETFMEQVCAKLKCLPSYADPHNGNEHVMHRLDALLKLEEEKLNSTPLAEQQTHDVITLLREYFAISGKCPCENNGEIKCQCLTCRTKILLEKIS